MAFAVEERSADWLSAAPTRLVREFELRASPEAVFAVLSDDLGWPLWNIRVRRVRVIEADDAAGVRRTVWMGASRLDEHVIVREEPFRIGFAVVSSNLPGLRTMVTDWQLVPVGAGCTRVRITIGFETSGVLRLAPGLTRAYLARSAKGAVGLRRLFG